MSAMPMRALIGLLAFVTAALASPQPGVDNDASVVPIAAMSEYCTTSALHPRADSSILVNFDSLSPGYPLNGDESYEGLYWRSTGVATQILVRPASSLNVADLRARKASTLWLTPKYNDGVTSFDLTSLFFACVTNDLIPLRQSCTIQVKGVKGPGDAVTSPPYTWQSDYAGMEENPVTILFDNVALVEHSDPAVAANEKHQSASRRELESNAASLGAQEFDRDPEGLADGNINSINSINAASTEYTATFDDLGALPGEPKAIPNGYQIIDRPKMSVLVTNYASTCLPANNLFSIDVENVYELGLLDLYGVRPVSGESLALTISFIESGMRVYNGRSFDLSSFAYGCVVINGAGNMEPFNCTLSLYGRGVDQSKTQTRNLGFNYTNSVLGDMARTPPDLLAQFSRLALANFRVLPGGMTLSQLRKIKVVLDDVTFVVHPRGTKRDISNIRSLTLARADEPALAAPDLGPLDNVISSDGADETLEARSDVPCAKGIGGPADLLTFDTLHVSVYPSPTKPICNGYGGLPWERIGVISSDAILPVSEPNVAATPARRGSASRGWTMQVYENGPVSAFNLISFYFACIQGEVAVNCTVGAKNKDGVQAVFVYNPPDLEEKPMMLAELPTTGDFDGLSSVKLEANITDAVDPKGYNYLCLDNVQLVPVLRSSNTLVGPGETEVTVDTPPF